MGGVNWKGGGGDILLLGFRKERHRQERKWARQGGCVCLSVCLCLRERERERKREREREKVRDSRQENKLYLSFLLWHANSSEIRDNLIHSPISVWLNK